MRLRAIVLAAGQGTRMKSDLPKVLFPVAGRHAALVERLHDPVGDLVSLVLILLHGPPLVRTPLKIVQHPIQRPGPLMDVACRLAEHLEEFLAARKEAESYHGVTPCLFLRLWDAARAAPAAIPEPVARKKER